MPVVRIFIFVFYTSFIRSLLSDIPSFFSFFYYSTFRFIIQFIILLCHSLSSAFFKFSGGAHSLPSIFHSFCIGYINFHSPNLQPMPAGGNLNDDYHNNHNRIRNFKLHRRSIQLSLLPLP
jgi:hypothetical protein